MFFFFCLLVTALIYLTRSTSDPAMTLVIDFFQGSGTTAEVAYRLGCLYIGVDEDPLAKDVATARVDKLKPAPLDFYKTKWKNALRWQIFVKDQTSVVVEVDDEAVGMCLYIN